jgi:hypothetical protein
MNVDLTAEEMELIPRALKEHMANRRLMHARPGPWEPWRVTARATQPDAR